MCTLLKMTLLPCVFVLFCHQTSSASTHNNCPITPVFSAIDSESPFTTGQNNRSMFGAFNFDDPFSAGQYDGTKFTYILKRTQVTFSCVANRPITVESELLMPSLLHNVVFAREVGNLFDKESYCYRVTFTSVNSYRAIGKYTCSVIAEPQLSSSMFLFTDKNYGNSLLNPGVNTLIKGFPDDDGWITLPCVPTNKLSVPKISIRGDKPLEKLKLEVGSFEYIPGLGFRIRAMYEECCGNSYICALNPQHVLEKETWTNITLYKNEALTSKVFYRVTPSDYVLGFNPEIETKLQIYPNQSTTLTCESNFAVKMEVNYTSLPAEQLVFEAELSSNGSSFYNHKATLQLTTLEAGLLTVVCRAMHNQEKIHRWRITTVSNKDRFPLFGPNVTYIDSESITCVTKNGQTPFMSYIECTDFMNCAIAAKLSHRILEANQKDFPFPVVAGHHYCPDYLQQYGFACASVSHKLPDNPVSSRLSPGTLTNGGLVMCSEALNDGTYLVNTHSFMIGFDKNVYLRDRARLYPDTNGVLRMKIVKHLLYVDEVVYVRCEAMHGFYAMGIQLAFHLQNGTKFIAVEAKEGLPYTEKLVNQVIVLDAAVKIHDPEITQIFCFAPIWDSEIWGNTSANVSVTAGVVPSIINSTTTEILRLGVGEVGHTLKCEFDGDPKPTTNWRMESYLLSPNSSRVKSIITTESATVLELESIVEAHAGFYSCEAISFKGFALKLFQIHIVSNKPRSYLTSDLGLYIGIPVVILLVAIILIYVLLQNRRSSGNQGLSADEINVFYQGCLPGSGVASSDRFLAEILFNEMPYNSSFELLSQNFEIERATILGEGQFGTVYKGQLKIEDVVETVAFKTCKSATDTKHLKCLLSEIKLMIYIGRHPYVIRFYGAYTRQLKFGTAHFAVEFCAKGSLDKILRNANQREISGVYENVADISNNQNVVSMLCDWSFQIASGMNYLAGKKIVHADLAARNILVAGDNAVRITDFGLSRRLANYANYSKMGTDDLLPWRWMALESLENLKFSTQSDIWSFGVTIWEIYSMGKIPYHNRSWTRNFADELRIGERLPHPEHAPNTIYEKLLQCWKVEEEQRPTFRDLSQFFQQISYEKQNISYVQHVST